MLRLGRLTASFSACSARWRSNIAGAITKLRLNSKVATLPDGESTRPRTTVNLNKPLQPHHDPAVLENQTARQFAIEHFVDQELKVTLGNKRVDREHQQPSLTTGAARPQETIVGSQDATFLALQADECLPEHDPLKALHFGIPGQSVYIDD